MYRAIVLAAFLVGTPSNAQTVNTSCEWVLGKWTCKSSPDEVLDHGKALQAGAALVKPYEGPMEPQPTIPKPQLDRVPPPPRDTDRDREFVFRLIPHCSVRGSLTDEDERRIAAVICIAYEQGEKDGALAALKAMQR